MSKLDNGKLSEVSGGLSGHSEHEGPSKVFKLGRRELEILARGGYIDDSGLIPKSNLEKAQNFLQESGWDGVLYVKGKDFDKLPEIINLIGKDPY